MTLYKCGSCGNQQEAEEAPMCCDSPMAETTADAPAEEAPKEEAPTEEAPAEEGGEQPPQ